MSQLKIWDATANNNQGAWVPAVIGAIGQTGPKGDAGQGVPAGGTNGQVLTKVGSGSGTDYQTEWRASTGGGSSVSTKFNDFLASTNGPINAFPKFDTTLASISYSASPAISGATVVACTSDNFTYRGLIKNPITISGTTYYRNSISGQDSARPYELLSFNVFWVEFDHYGTQFDIRYASTISTQYSQIWVWVDGVPITEKPVYSGPSVGAMRYQTVTLAGSTAKQRRIRVMIGASDFAGIGLANSTDTIFPVEQKLLKVVFYDGSWFQGGSGLSDAYTTGGTLSATYNSNVVSIAISSGTQLVNQGDTINVTGLTYANATGSTTNPFTVTSVKNATTLTFAAPTGTTGVSGIPVVTVSGAKAYLNEQLSVQLGEMMNVDYYVNALGGTGYVNGSNLDPILGYVVAPLVPPDITENPNWCDPGRLAAVKAFNPDLVIFCGTTNDDYFTDSSYQLGNHAKYAYDYIKTNLPNARVIVFTRQSNGTPTESVGTAGKPQYTANATTVRNAATERLTTNGGNVIGIVNPFLEGWVNGLAPTVASGSIAASPGSGNASIFIATDAHPNPTGNHYYANRMFNRIVDIIKDYTRS